MNKLYIKRVNAHRLPGMPHGLRLNQELARHINIITGPNGSGKSSLALAMSQTLQQKGQPGTQVTMDAQQDDNRWLLSVDGNFASALQNDISAQFEALTNPLDHRRFVLALDQIIKEDDRDLGAEIRRELSGGYDISGAKQKLGYGFNTPTRRGVFKDIQTAERKVSEVQQAQDQLHRQTATIDDKERERKEHQARIDNVRFYTNEHERRALIRQFEQDERALAAFHPGMARLREDDLENYRDAMQKRDAAQQELIQIERKSTELKEQRKALNLPHEIDRNALSSGLNHVLENARELSRKSSDLKQSFAGKSKELQSAAEALGLSPELPEGGGLPAGWEVEYEQALDNYYSQLGPHQVNKERLAAFSETPEEAKTSIEEGDRLRQGRSLLVQWMQTAASGGAAVNPQKQAPTIWIIAGLILALVAAAGAFFTNEPLATLVPALLGAAVLIIALLASHKSNATPSGAGGDLVSMYQRLGLPTPSDWSPEGVAQIIENLNNELVKFTLAEANAQERAKLQKSIDETEKNLEAIRQKFRAALASIGLQSKGENSTPAAMALVIRHAMNWYRLREELHGIEAQQTEVNASIAKLVDTFNQLVTPLGQPSVAEISGVSTASDALLKRLEQHHGLTGELTGLASARQREEERMNLEQKRINDVFERLGLTSGDERVLEDMHSRLPDYRELAAEHTLRKRQLDAFNAQLEQVAPSLKEELAAMTDDDLAGRMDSVEADRAEVERLSNEIADLRAKARQQSEGNDLETAINERERQLEGLELAFEEFLNQSIGEIVVDEIMQQSRQSNDSQVFSKAEELFGVITRHRWALLVPDADNAPFRARDTASGVVHTLDELSTGTRIQLLLAVRLAYIERIEGDLKLPLFVDELLANSDDERANAIIESLIEIARTGRQVFYFTAQKDEVAKWKTRLAAMPEISSTLLELVSGQSQPLDPAELPSQQPSTGVPAPEGDDHRRYGARLGVPSFDPLSMEASAVHLWYLVSDVNQLHALLRAGIVSCGQLMELREHPVADFSGDWNAFHQSFRKRVDLVRRMIELYRRGRARIITRDDLERSQSITSIFLNRTAELLAAHGGNPALLLADLKAGKLARFRSDNADQLEDWLSEQGLLGDPNDQLSADALQSQARIEGAKLQLDPTTVDWVVAWICRDAQSGSVG